MTFPSQPLYYLQEGTGTPVVLIAGLNAESTFWQATSFHLKKSFQVIMPDNRGIGGTGFLEPECTTELMAQDIIRLLDSLNISRAHIVGHSLGGCVAQQIAILYPERVDNLVLCSTPAKQSPLDRYKIKTRLEMLNVEHMPRELFIKHVFTALFSDTFFEDEETVNQAVQYALLKPLEESRKTYLYQVPALLNHDTSNVLTKITAKTLILGGEEDISVPPRALKFLAEHIAHSKLVILPNMAHMLPLEAPQVFCQYVLDFLSDKKF